MAARIAFDGVGAALPAKPVVFQLLDSANPHAVDVREPEDLGGELFVRVDAPWLVHDSDPR